MMIIFQIILANPKTKYWKNFILGSMPCSWLKKKVQVIEVDNMCLYFSM
jgi:hypothetical protein